MTRTSFCRTSKNFRFCNIILLLYQSLLCAGQVNIFNFSLALRILVRYTPNLAKLVTCQRAHNSADYKLNYKNKYVGYSTLHVGRAYQILLQSIKNSRRFSLHKLSNTNKLKWFVQYHIILKLKTYIKSIILPRGSI